MPSTSTFTDPVSFFKDKSFDAGPLGTLAPSNGQLDLTVTMQATVNSPGDGFYVGLLVSRIIRRGQCSGALKRSGIFRIAQTEMRPANITKKAGETGLPVPATRRVAIRGAKPPNSMTEKP